MDAPAEPTRVGPAAVVAGGLALVASAFLPWLNRGAGSSLALHDLGDFVLGGSVSSVLPRWVGAIAYLIPALGALTIVVASVETRWSRATAIASAALAGVLIVIATVTPLVRHLRPDLGQLAAALGELGLVAGLTMSR